MFCPQCGKPATDTQKFCAACGAALDATAAAARPGYASIDADSVYAPLGRRCLAYFIDCVVYVAVFVLVVMLVGASRNAWLLLVWLGAMWLYKAGMESSKYQATLGKRALGVQVTAEDGQRLSFAHATGRMVAFLIFNAIALISFLVAAFSSRRQSLHDMVASTLVVRKGLTPQEIATAPPATSGGASVAAIVIVVAFMGVVFIGILAAIAIPAYQDYTIRSQIAEGLQLAAPFEAQVAQAGANGVDVSTATAQTLGIIAPTSGHYVQAVALDYGAVVITYGGAANSLIQGHKLVLYPVKYGSGSIAWICGYRELDGTRLDVPRLESAMTDIPGRVLPRLCRR